MKNATAVSVSFSVLLLLILGGIGSFGYHSISIISEESTAISNIPTDTIVWETISNPDFLDPHINYESFGNWVFYNVYETLYTYPWDSNTTDTLIPLLAEGLPSISADGLNFTITLRQGVTFHDGTSFNASCVQWNVYRAAKIFYLDGPFWMLADLLLGGTDLMNVAYGYDPDSPEYASAFDTWVTTISPVEVLEEYAVRFRLQEPRPYLPSVLASWVGSIMSPTYALNHASSPSNSVWDQYGVDYGEWDGWMTEHCCGTGPYKMEEWVIDQYIHLGIFENYWREGPERSGEIADVLIETEEDVNSRLLNLQTGITDGCYWPISHSYDIWDPVSKSSLNPSIAVSTGGLTYSLSAIGMNQADLLLDNGTTITGPFQDLNLRKAAATCFDYSSYIETTLHDFGLQARGPIPIGMFGHNSSTFDCEMNLTAAVDYWNAAVGNPSVAQAIHDLGDEFVLYYTMGNTRREQACLILRDGLESVFSDPMADMTSFPGGITVTVVPLEWANYLNYQRERRMVTWFAPWLPDYSDPNEFLYSYAYSRGYQAYSAGYNNSQVNDWYRLQREEFDSELRLYYISGIQEQLNEDFVYLWLEQWGEFRTWRAELQGNGL
ncbi:MAG: ABC transporter substrate-binding protein, partial [Promethearchaeota archaeon]